jgi:hypothetical protein
MVFRHLSQRKVLKIYFFFLSSSSIVLHRRVVGAKCFHKWTNERKKKKEFLHTNFVLCEVFNFCLWLNQLFVGHCNVRLVFNTLHSPHRSTSQNHHSVILRFKKKLVEFLEIEIQQSLDGYVGVTWRFLPIETTFDKC